MNDSTDTDFGAPFAAQLTAVEHEAGERAPAALLVLLARHLPEFAAPRRGDPTPALRLLAVDGLFTDRLAALPDAAALGALARRVAV